MKKPLASIILISLIWLTAALNLLSAETNTVDITKQYDRLITQLSAPKWKTREKAEQKAVTLGKENPNSFLTKALETYLNTDDPEVKIRIKDVIREVVIHQHFNKKRAFLGIAMHKETKPLIIEKKTYFPITCKYIIPDTAAEKMGLKAGDQILEADGNVCDLNYDTTHLVRHISRKKAGDKIKLLVYKNTHVQSMDIVLGTKPDIAGDMPEEKRMQLLFESWLKDNIKAAKQKTNGQLPENNIEADQDTDKVTPK